MIRILITGGAGHIGASLANRLARKSDHLIYVLDNLLTGSIKNLHQSKNINFLFGDINEGTILDQLSDIGTFDFIFHYSAVVGVERTQRNPLLVLKDIDGFKNILKLAVDHNSNRVFFASSSEVYGEPFEIPQNEMTTPLNSRVPYAIIKNLGESFFRTYQKEFNLNFTIFRFFNTYGPLQSRDFVISKFIELALNNEDIPIYGDGNQTRTFLHVDDNINFTVDCLHKGLFLNDVVNVGSDVEVTIEELAAKIIHLSNSRSKIIFLDPLKEGDMTRRKPDLAKFKSAYGKTFISLDSGILDLIEHFKT